MFTKKILRGSFPKVVLNVYLVSKVEQLRLECIVKISTVTVVIPAYLILKKH